MSMKTATLLSISPRREDHAEIEAVLQQTVPLQATPIEWQVRKCATIRCAIGLLARHEIQVVVCDRDVEPTAWLDLLEEVSPSPNAPLIIVTSRLADERLWGQVLNHGGWDVLAKPLRPAEAKYIIESAWRHWQQKRERQAAACGTVLTAS
jgi:DNA-binding NtrC family response regulator